MLVLNQESNIKISVCVCVNDRLASGAVSPPSAGFQLRKL